MESEKQTQPSEPPAAEPPATEPPAEREPWAVTSVEMLEGIHAMTGVKVVHATATWCKACGRIKREVGAQLAVDVTWATVSVQDVEGAQEAMNIDSMPRVDVIDARGNVTTFSGFDCKTEDIFAAVARAREAGAVPQLVLDADF
jgi:hypothetical protein